MPSRRLASTPAAALSTEEQEQEEESRIIGAVLRLRPGQPVLARLVASSILISEAAGLRPRHLSKAAAKRTAAQQEEDELGPVLVSIEQAAARFGIGKTLMRKLSLTPVRKGGVIVLRMGDRIMVPVSEFEDWIKREKSRQRGIVE